MPILNWLDREEEVKAANEIPYHLLEEDSELSYRDPGRICQAYRMDED